MRRGHLLLAGCSALVLSFAMALVGGSVFTMSSPPSPAVNLLGEVCFIGAPFATLAGLALLIVALVSPRR